jgi:hypothetical protein
VRATPRDVQMSLSAMVLKVKSFALHGCLTHVNKGGVVDLR